MSISVFDRTYHDTPYRLELCTEEDRMTLTAEATDTGELWRGEFTARFIEEITGKTGNAKKFCVFEKMLVKGLEGGSATVVADLLSAQELDNLRSRKPGKAGQLSSRVGNRKYLILTYCVEFDKVHYPLPLLPEERDTDPDHLRSTIRRLRSELRDLRSSMSKGEGGSQALIEENLRLRARVRELETQESEEYLQQVEDLKGQVETQRAESAATIRQLKAVNLQLQDELDHMKSEMDAVISQIEEDQRQRAALPDAKTLRQMAEDYYRLRQTVQDQKAAIEQYKSLLGEVESVAQRSSSAPRQVKSALISPSPAATSKQKPKLCSPAESTLTKLDRILKLMKP